jgi:hypothetical protein
LLRNGLQGRLVSLIAILHLASTVKHRKLRSGRYAVAKTKLLLSEPEIFMLFFSDYLRGMTEESKLAENYGRERNIFFLLLQIEIFLYFFRVRLFGSLQRLCWLEHYIKVSNALDHIETPKSFFLFFLFWVWSGFEH